MGSELIDKQFIIPESFDEIKWCKSKHNEVVYGNDVLALEILSTRMCNFKCSYCFEEHEPAYIQPDVETHIIQFLCRKIPKSKQVRLAWFGGEPLLNSESILRITSVADDLCKKHGVPMYGEISTNGYLLSADLMRKLVKMRIVDFQVCLDGPEEQHNRARPHREADDSYSVILNNLISIKNNVKSRFFRLAIRTNITPHVEPYLEEHLLNLSRLFAGDNRFNILFQCVRNWGGNNISHDQIVDDESLRYEKWYKRVTRLGLKGAGSWDMVPFYGYCPANRRNGYVIDCNGDILKCSLAMNTTHEDVNRIGYIGDYGREILDQNKVAQWIVTDEDSLACRHCFLYPFCMGGHCFFQRNIKKDSSSCNQYLKPVINEKLIEMDALKQIPVLYE